jgi:hypothetical protein
MKTKHGEMHDCNVKKKKKKKKKKKGEERKKKVNYEACARGCVAVVDKRSEWSNATANGHTMSSTTTHRMRMLFQRTEQLLRSATKSLTRHVLFIMLLRLGSERGSTKHDIFAVVAAAAHRHVHFGTDRGVEFSIRHFPFFKSRILACAESTGHSLQLQMGGRRRAGPVQWRAKKVQVARAGLMDLSGNGVTGKQPSHWISTQRLRPRRCPQAGLHDRFVSYRRQRWQRR